MPSPARDRVTVDLRGVGERLRAQGAAQRMSTGAFVRRAVVLQLDGAVEPAEGLVPAAAAGPVVKLTLRVSAAHAVALATRARQADTTVSRRSVQVMVKVIGGGRGMAAIAAHFRYISKSGRLDIEDDRGVINGVFFVTGCRDELRPANARNHLKNTGRRPTRPRDDCSSVQTRRQTG